MREVLDLNTVHREQYEDEQYHMPQRKVLIGPKPSIPLSQLLSPPVRPK